MRRSRALSDVTEWLAELLTEEIDGLDKRDIIRLARDNGFAERTVHRARERLRIHVRTTGFGKDKRSRWALPIPANRANDANHGTLAQMARLGTNAGATLAKSASRCLRCDGEGCPHCDPEAAREVVAERSAIIEEGSG